MSLGLKRGIVQLEPHDKQWDEIALQTIKTLKSILGDDAIDIYNILEVQQYRQLKRNRLLILPLE